jgi:hypothetical protein
LIEAARPHALPHKQENVMVQVWAKDAAMAALLTHPLTKVGFTDPSLPANWPDDQFTARRIRDGDVTTTDPNAGEPRTSRRASSQEKG